MEGTSPATTPTGTPMSTVSTLNWETNMATVPPPPWSTLPSSPVCQVTLARSRIPPTKAINSAEASLVEDFPLAPVYLVRTGPYPR